MDYNLKATMWDMREMKLFPYDYEKGGEQLTGEIYEGHKVYCMHIHDTLPSVTSVSNLTLTTLPVKSFLIGAKGYVKRSSGAVGAVNTSISIGTSIYLNTNRKDVMMNCDTNSSKATYDISLYYIHE